MCVCVCICTYVYGYAYANVWMCIYVCVCVCMGILRHTCMSIIILRFMYDDASMYVLTPVPPYSCAHTKVYIKKILIVVVVVVYIMLTFVPSYS